MDRWKQMAVLLVLLAWAVSFDGQGVSSPVRIPVVQGTSFADRPVNLPSDLHEKIGVLVIGFSEKSRDSMKGWGVRLMTDFGRSGRVAFYEMPVLAGAPRLLRGYIAGKIKETLNDRAKLHFVPIMENEDLWRGVTRYKDKDEAYVLLVDAKGAVLWQTHGVLKEDLYSELKGKISDATSSSGTGR